MLASFAASAPVIFQSPAEEISPAQASSTSQTSPPTQLNSPPDQSTRKRAREPRRCGVCHQSDHIRTSCPILLRLNTMLESCQHYFILIDGEITYLGARKNRLCSFAWAILDQHGMVISATKKALINPDPIQVHKDALKVHRLTNEYLRKEGKPFKDAIQPFLCDISDLPGKGIFVSQDPFKVDVPFLFWEFTRNDIQFPEKIVAVINTVPLARKFFPSLPNHKLETLYKKITGDDLINCHDAAVDVEALIKIFSYQPIFDIKRQAMTCIEIPLEKHAKDVAGELRTRKKKKQKLDPEVEKLWSNLQHPIKDIPFTGPRCQIPNTRAAQTPLTAFKLLFKPLERLVIESTNRYAKKKIHESEEEIRKEGREPKLRPWYNLTGRELDKFISILLLSGVHQKRTDTGRKISIYDFTMLQILCPK